MKLNLNCNVEYQSLFLTKAESDKLLIHLKGFSELTIFLKSNIQTGESFTFNFGKMMFLDKELYENNEFPENIWGPTRIWSDEMLSIKNKIESFTNNSFGVCVCIFYPDGNSGVDYHSDYSAFGDTTIIPSLSLGEEREFGLREKETLLETKIILEHGSLVVMGEHCQERYEHSLPNNSKYRNARINLTFRKFGFD